MQGVLNKTSNGVSPTERITPPSRPPKVRPRRGIPHFRLPSGIRKLARWGNRQSLAGSQKLSNKDGRVEGGGGVRFAEEEEPKTEDSFDYKDIDFATDIFDFRAPVPTTVNRPVRKPPPVPPSPQMDQKETINSPSDASPTKMMATFSEIPLIDDHDQREKANVAVTVEEIERQPVVVVDENVTETSGDLNPEEKLTKFLRDHEGLELSEADVEELEKLLNETDDAERESDERERPIETQTHFDDEILSEEEVNAERHIPRIVDEVPHQLEEEPKGHTDFSVVEFNKSDNLSRSGSPGKPVKIVDDGIYEPVGEPIVNCQSKLRQKPPDMSGFVPPKASTNIGDPFSWRRRGMRRWDRYGYESSKTNSSYIPATMQIVEGCRQVENYIISRHLSPPGYLLDVLGTHRKLKRRRKKKKKPVPTISIVHQLPSVSYSLPDKQDNVTNVILLESFEELKNNLTKTEMESLIDESEKRPEVAVVEVLVVNCSPPLQVEEVQAEIVESKIEDGNGNPFNVSEVVEDSLPINKPTRISRKDTFSKKDRPPRPLPPTPSSIQDMKPTRPSRRVKRVSSAEPPKVEVASLEADKLFVCQTFPRAKVPSRRSISAEEVQRRIQLQAQQFFRTPRKKELRELALKSRDHALSGSSSVGLYETVRRRTRSPRHAPVYTPINKSQLRKRDFASQTGSNEEDGGDDRESIPPSLPPKIHKSLLISTDQLEGHLGEEKIHHTATEFETSAVPKEFEATKVPKEFEAFPVPKDFETSPVPKEFDTSSAPKEFEATSVPKAEEVVVSSSSDLPSSGNLMNFDNILLQKLVNLDGQCPIALFCGFLPAGRTLSTNLTELPEMTVHRLNVDHLEAGSIKVGQIEADHMLIQPVENTNQSLSFDRTETKETEIEKGNAILPEDFPNENETTESSVADVNGNDKFEYERPLYWDEGSPWNERMIPSSSSASYVTCDETLHESMTDSEFGTDVEEDFDQDDQVPTGSTTPIPLDLDVERDVDYDLLRQVFEAAVVAANGNNNNNNVLQ